MNHRPAVASRPMTVDTFSNPVYAGSFADPFVLLHGGWYSAFGTDT